MTVRRRSATAAVRPRTVAVRPQTIAVRLQTVVVRPSPWDVSVLHPEAKSEGMTDGDRLTLLGLYLAEPVYDALAETLYEDAGVVDLETYFDPAEPELPADDPGGVVTDALLASVTGEFAALYERADFEAVEAVPSDGFVLTHLAARPGRVADARELFEAAATIRRTDLRTVHTALVAAQLDVEPVR